MDHFNAIRVFIRVVETSSITRAAARLTMPKSTASKLLAELEAALGVRLLNRTTRAVSLTDEGTRYYRQVAPLLARLCDVEAELKNEGSLPRGSLRVDVHSAMANSVLIPILGEFRAQYPSIQLVLGISDRPISLVEEAADCVIRLGRLPDTSLIARLIYEDRLVTCASPLYLTKRGLPASPDDLVQHHDLVGYFSATSGASQPLIFQRDGVVRQLDHTHILTNDSTGQLGMLLAGFGVGQVYEATARTHLESGELVRVLEDWETPSSPVSVVYPPAKRNNQRVRLFVDWVVKRLSTNIL
ncbi:MAG: LysR family transcriptional regulator [Alcaligenaceae bacterium]|nr:LysR family transcriptional regulator [Alcaligenaceae bacterium]